MRFILMVWVVLFSTQLGAQEFKSLESVLENNPAPTYPFVRCGGMYQAMLERIGYERMGEEAWSQNDEARSALLIFGGLMLSDQLPNTSQREIGEITANDARRIADIYEQRMNNNFALTGEAFFSDSLIKSDLSFCKRLSEEIVPIIRNLN